MFLELNKHYTRKSDGRTVALVSVLDELTEYPSVIYRRIGQDKCVTKTAKEFLEEFVEVDYGRP